MHFLQLPVLLTIMHSVTSVRRAAAGIVLRVVVKFYGSIGEVYSTAARTPLL